MAIISGNSLAISGNHLIQRLDTTFHLLNNARIEASTQLWGKGTERLDVSTCMQAEESARPF